MVFTALAFLIDLSYDIYAIETFGIGQQKTLVCKEHLFRAVQVGYTIYKLRIFITYTVRSL